MGHLENSTASSNYFSVHTDSATLSQAHKSSGNAYFYMLIVMAFYGIFLCGIMLGYFRSKRKEKKRINVFTRLVHEEEQREWGALPKKHSLAGLRAMHVSLPFNHGDHLGHLQHEGALSVPLACAFCAEHSSVSSLCSSADAHFAIEEESDSGTAEGSDDNPKVNSENSGEDLS
ncbi:potassium voltage-gated channel subfamily E member 4 [Thalassophryne amazonica]|uniref:potassium voltage-gated channel subfamily E member 4 n=1 Tax=Thalassophryne amazonica TaxID=390379 RepID=UPI001470EBA1|nr:potassium voltage-gated channel subfamily E member 4 [Thalassophryne amazonica]